jgi:hypothetical protein
MPWARRQKRSVARLQMPSMPVCCSDDTASRAYTALAAPNLSGGDAKSSLLAFANGLGGVTGASM